MRALALMVGAVLLLGSSCSGQPGEAPSAELDAIAESRTVLGDPMVQLAEAVIALSDGVDQARHDVPRGDDMRLATRELRQRIDDVDAAAEAAATAADAAPVEEAGGIVAAAAEQAQVATEAAREEIAFLRRVSRIDTALIAAAATWDEPGSQTEIRLRLDALATDVGKLRSPARRLDSQPEACDGLQLNRSEWITTVRQRTLRLQGNANSAAGTEFDRLRKSYRPLPFAVEPRTADRADRQCWLDESLVAQTEADVRAAVDELQAALQT